MGQENQKRCNEQCSMKNACMPLKHIPLHHSVDPRDQLHASTLCRSCTLKRHNLEIAKQPYQTWFAFFVANLVLLTMYLRIGPRTRREKTTQSLAPRNYRNQRGVGGKRLEISVVWDNFGSSTGGGLTLKNSSERPSFSGNFYLIIFVCCIP